jgi:hypothetical protein
MENKEKLKRLKEFYKSELSEKEPNSFDLRMMSMFENMYNGTHVYEGYYIYTKAELDIYEKLRYKG